MSQIRLRAEVVCKLLIVVMPFWCMHAQAQVATPKPTCARGFTAEGKLSPPNQEGRYSCYKPVGDLSCPSSKHLDYQPDYHSLSATYDSSRRSNVARYACKLKATKPVPGMKSKSVERGCAKGWRVAPAKTKGGVVPRGAGNNSYLCEQTFPVKDANCYQKAPYNKIPYTWGPMEISRNLAGYVLKYSCSANWN